MQLQQAEAVHRQSVCTATRETETETGCALDVSSTTAHRLQTRIYPIASEGGALRTHRPKGQYYRRLLRRSTDSMRTVQSAERIPRARLSTVLESLT